MFENQFYIEKFHCDRPSDNNQYNSSPLSMGDMFQDTSGFSKLQTVLNSMYLVFLIHTHL